MKRRCRGGGGKPGEGKQRKGATELNAGERMNRLVQQRACQAFPIAGHRLQQRLGIERRECRKCGDTRGEERSEAKKSKAA